MARLFFRSRARATRDGAPTGARFASRGLSAEAGAGPAASVAPIRVRTSFVAPIWITSPTESRTWETRSPLTRVPFAVARSTRTTPTSRTSISAWRGSAAGSSIAIGRPFPDPTMTGASETSIFRSGRPSTLSRNASIDHLPGWCPLILRISPGSGS